MRRAAEVCLRVLGPSLSPSLKKGALSPILCLYSKQKLLNLQTRGNKGTLIHKYSKVPKQTMRCKRVCISRLFEKLRSALAYGLFLDSNPSHHASSKSKTVSLHAYFLRSLAHPFEMLCIHSIFVTVHHTSCDASLKDVHLRTRELSGRHALLEEHVHLGESAAHGLGHAEVSVHNAEKTDAGL